MRKILAILALALFIAPASADYLATQGAGTQYGSKVVGTSPAVHYPQWVLCDPTTPANCAKVQVGTAAATTDLAVTVIDPNVLSALNTVNTNLDTLNTTAGNPIPTIAGTNPSTQPAVAIGATTKAQTDLNGNLYISPQQAGGAPLGQALAAASMPVVLPAAQLTTLTPIALNDPCGPQNTKLGAPINLTASGQVIAGTASKKTYTCAIDVVPSAAQNIALVEGTGTVCATNIFGLAGGTTAATGWNFQLGGGIARGSGNGTVYSPSGDTNATAANVCLLIQGAGQVSGQISYVQQ